MADLSPIAFLQVLGFGDLLLWLLTFAIVYGILTQVKVPKSKATRGIIAIVSGFFVLISVPSEFLSVITSLSGSMIIIILAFLVLLIFIEIGGIRHTEIQKIKDKDGNEREIEVGVNLFSKNSYVIAAAFIIIGILVFIGAGGLGFLGFDNLPPINITGIAIIIVVLIGVLWMIRGE